MVTQVAHTKIYIETKAAILDPVNLAPQQSYREFFEQNQDAQSLWVLRPGAREPFRISWRQALYPERREGSRKERAHNASRKERTS